MLHSGGFGDKILRSNTTKVPSGERRQTPTFCGWMTSSQESGGKSLKIIKPKLWFLEERTCDRHTDPTCRSPTSGRCFYDKLLLSYLIYYQLLNISILYWIKLFFISFRVFCFVLFAFYFCLFAVYSLVFCVFEFILSSCHDLIWNQ